MALVKKGTGGSVPMFLALVIVTAIAVSSACLAATASNAYICSSTTCGFSSYLVLRTFGMLHFHFTMFIYIGIASYIVQFKQRYAGLIHTARPRGARLNVLPQAYGFANMLIGG
jgi:hypothetical protein